METVILHDRRLNGTVEAGIGRVIQVDGNTALAQGLQNAAAAAVRSPTQLAIACHGFMTHSYDGASNIDLRGGTGLQLCRESLRLNNLSMVSALRGHFTRIWLMACGPAGTLVHSSRPFCREFAHYADAEVIASDTAQLYSPGIYDPAALVSRRVLRFGGWEGNVYSFRPDGTVQPASKNASPLQ